MVIGFTGSKAGMTARQAATVRYLLLELQCVELHHGDRIGSDAQADGIALDLGLCIHVHPPTDSKLRAFRINPPRVIYPPRPYLQRDQDMIDIITGLIAIPQEYIEKLRSGTWATIRYARKARRRVWIVVPDGTFREEQ